METASMNEKPNKQLHKKKMTVKDFFVKNNQIFVLILLVIVSSFMSRSFFTKLNAFNLIRQYALYMFLTVGMLSVVMTGSIDLSMGSTLGFGGMCFAAILTELQWGQNNAWGLLLAILAVAAIGALVGVINGLLVANARLMSFMATLSTQIVVRGLAYLVTTGAPERIFATNKASQLMMDICAFNDPIIGLPYLFYIIIALLFIFSLVFRYTKYGRLCLMTGSNEMAVRYAGINVKKYKFIPFIISGVMAALAGAILCGRAGTATATAGEGYPFDAIAAIVIGGGSLAGGKGDLPRAALGMCVLALISNILNLLSMPTATQQIVKGVIIISAVLLLDAGSRKRDITM